MDSFHFESINPILKMINLIRKMAIVIFQWINSILELINPILKMVNHIRKMAIPILEFILKLINAIL